MAHTLQAPGQDARTSERRLRRLFEAIERRRQARAYRVALRRVAAQYGKGSAR